MSCKLEDSLPLVTNEGEGGYTRLRQAGTGSSWDNP